MTAHIVCPYCDRPAELVTGDKIYPHRLDLFAKKFWCCQADQAWVGCHPPAQRNGRGGIGNGSVPLGRLANAELRRTKSAAHAVFDPLWRSGDMSRRDAYVWLAAVLCISRTNCHIGMFDVDLCLATIEAVKARNATPVDQPTPSAQEK